eukprot:3818547-Pleurochrysis_carterae.AAC.1
MAQGVRRCVITYSACVRVRSAHSADWMQIADLLKASQGFSKLLKASRAPQRTLTASPLADS